MTDAATGTPTDPDSARAWVEFDDPAFADRRYRCDLTWLTSRWTCIYGAGCRSIDFSVPEGGCCVLGAHLAGAGDLAALEATVRRLPRQLWQHHPGRTGRQAWSEPAGDGVKTRVVDGACIFLNRDGFETGRGCALHHLAVRDEVPTHTYKPEACWQVPLRRTHRAVERADGTSYLEVTITELQRRDWGTGWREIDWYCTDDPSAHVSRIPVYRGMRDELTMLMGEAAYGELVRHASAWEAAQQGAGSARPLALFVHPATAAAACGEQEA